MIVREMNTDSEIMDVRDLAVAHHEEYGGSREFSSAAVCEAGLRVRGDPLRRSENCWIAYAGEKPVGYLAATCVQNFYNWRLIATQQMWYVLPEFRGSRAGVRLVRAFEEWARERRCEAIYMGVEHNVANAETERTAHLIGRLGYSMRGTYAVKHIG